MPQLSPILWVSFPFIMGFLLLVAIIVLDSSVFKGMLDNEIKISVVYKVVW